MSDRELAKSLIDKIPESRMYYVISYLQDEAVPDEVPNATTIAAIEELESGGGEAGPGARRICGNTFLRRKMSSYVRGRAE